MVYTDGDDIVNTLNASIREANISLELMACQW